MKMRSAIYLLVLIALAEGLPNDHGDLDLVQVQIIFRHGDRTPVTIYPSDPYGESQWQKYGGLGQLTQTGMLQHFQYGKKTASFNI